MRIKTSLWTRKSVFILAVLVVVIVILAVQYPFHSLNAEAAKEGKAMEGKVRPAVVADQFYPGNPGVLAKTVDEYLTKAKDIEVSGDTHAIIVPHAGYIYSGQVAAAGFKALSPSLKRFFIIAANHTRGVGYFKISVSDSSYFETPLGKVRVSPIAVELLKDKLFQNVPEAQSSHIIEVELPFLQRKYKDFEIIPLVIGVVDSNDIKKAAEVISKYINNEAAIIISSDLSHYHPYKEAVELDTSCIKAFAELDIETASRSEACGLSAAMILITIAKEKGWKGKVIEYKNSGDTAGDMSAVVGYSSIAFYDGGLNKPEELEPTPSNQDDLSAKEKEQLLALARLTISTYVKDGKQPAVNEADFSARLKRREGCFVTLHKDGRLRGCIGSLIATTELYKCVVQNAINAAENDPRFSPVQASEIPNLHIEISVLTEPKPLKVKSPEELLQTLVPLKHGVILQNAWRSSTYLPQVWEDLPDKVEFLTSLCRKGGMPPDCWKDPNTEVLVYEAIVFGEAPASKR